MYYQITTKDNQPLAEFKVFYDDDKLNVTYYFDLYLKPTYSYAKSLSDGDLFIEQLTKLREDLYDFFINCREKKIISTKITDKDYKICLKKMDEDKKTIENWFLPKLKAFIKDWNLCLNED